MAAREMTWTRGLTSALFALAGTAGAAAGAQVGALAGAQANALAGAQANALAGAQANAPAGAQANAPAGAQANALAAAQADAPAGASMAQPAPALVPFAAHYTADWKSINVGTSDIELTEDGVPGHYLYTWTVTARGIFRLAYSDDVIQKSWLSVSGGQVRPERYRAQQGDSTVAIDFDWQRGRAQGVAEKRPVDLALDAGTQDVMSIQIEVMLDLSQGHLPKTFSILEKDQIKEFNYTLEGPARIRTALGMLDTVVVASQRSGNNRILRMWFAPSLGYVPVQAERSRDGKLEFALRIKTLKR